LFEGHGFTALRNNCLFEGTVQQFEETLCWKGHASGRACWDLNKLGIKAFYVSALMPSTKLISAKYQTRIQFAQIRADSRQKGFVFGFRQQPAARS
jgi:hypothetical protein